MNTKVSKTKLKKKSKKKSKSLAKNAHEIALRNKPLCVLTEEALDGYFKTLNGHRPIELHQLVIAQVEKPLLERVMQYAKGNQSSAAEILGLNRGTLRKKLLTYNLL